MTSINVAIVDDDSLIVSLLQGFIGNQEGINVSMTAQGGKDLFKLLEETENIPDVMLLDLKMKGMDGIEISQYLKTNYPSIKIIIISSHYQLSFLGFMLQTGIAAFLPKGVSPNELVRIIRIIHEKGFYFLEDQIDVIKEELSFKSPKPLLEQGTLLTSREIEVLRLLSKQKTAKEIGELLFITQRTVEGHKNNLFIKTGAKNIAGLVIYSIQHNIIRVEDLPAI